MLRILLVDDEREEREGISFLIKKYNFPLTVLQASNGREALKYIQEQSIDILFTDVKMPIMNGLDLAKTVYEYNPAIKIIIYSAYSEFDYAKQALSANAVGYLLKPIEIDEFKKLMNEVIISVNEAKESHKRKQEDEEQYRKNLFYKLFYSARIEPEEEERISKYIFSKMYSACTILNIEFITNFLEEQEEVFINYISMYLGKQSVYVKLYPNEAYLLVPKSRELSGLSLDQQLKKLIRDLNMREDNELLIVNSTSVTSIQELQEQLQCIKSIKNKIFGYGNRIIETNDYFHDDEHYVSDVEMIRKEVIKAIEEENAEHILQYCNQLIILIQSLHNLSKLYTQNLFYSIIKAIYDKMPKVEYEQVLVSAEQLFHARDPQSVIKDFESSLKAMLEPMGNRCLDESRITQKIKNLVETEYMKEISLSYVAEKVNLAPAYVSYIFKQETGQTLVKYITDIKMQKAKKLLEEGNLKIVKVGRACGYENQSYFNRMFKNYYGVTPKQFREKL
jgi:two-component system, response regulator YesN